MVVIYHREAVVSMTIREYRLELGWPISRLARAAGLAPQTVSRIEDGEPAFDYTVAAIAKALSKELGRNITVDDLDNVKIVGRD
jgi:transcriptional regulator with XRE-family HTH domain